MPGWDVRIHHLLIFKNNPGGQRKNSNCFRGRQPKHPGDFQAFFFLLLF